MLPAIGAASMALDAIQSLTSPQSSSSAQSVFPDLGGDSNTSSSNSSPVSGFSGAQISSDNLNALIGAQGLESGDALDSSNSISDSSPASSASGAASSTYSAINQLMQSTAVPLGFSPFSVSA